MKMINGCISRSAKFAFTVVLLALLPQMSHQNMGRKQCSAAQTNTVTDLIRIINEYHCLG